MSATKSQTEAIREALERGEKLTPLDALNRFGCLRLGARVWDLRDSGMNIVSRMVGVGHRKKVAEYSLQNT